MTEQDQESNNPDKMGVQDKDGGRRSYAAVAIIAVTIFVILAVLMVFFLLRDRSEPEEEPTATPVPTEVTEFNDATWAAIQERGVIVVGTAANYPPFEFRNRDFQLDGLDIAIIKEIGRRLGLAVEMRDMAFDGLVNALRVQQIDVAISAITITDQRRQFVDFSDTYFVSADALLAAENASFDTISDPAELAGLRLGVERGTIYESWAETDLVETGLVQPDDVFEYDRMEDAIADLRAGRIDLVALDLQPAQVAESRGGLKIVAQGLNQQYLGIAVPKGASELLVRLNDSLQEMDDDGTLRSLLTQYAGLSEEAIQPLPSVEPTPVDEVPPATSGCIDSAEYVGALSYDDQGLTEFSVLNAGESFRKGWRLRNTGTCTWARGYALAPAGGERMGGELALVSEPVSSGDEYDFWVDLVAPIIPGQYVGYWSLRNNQSGLLFGDRVSIAVEIIQAAQPTPLPTQTPVPGISFSAGPGTIQQGQCSTLSWNTENVQSVYLYEQGEDWRLHPVAGSGTLTVCPPATTTYELRVAKNDSSVEVRTTTVFVTPNASVPQITRFTVDPPDQIAVNQCVTIRWAVEGSVSSVSIGRSGVVIWPRAPFGGSLQDCPASLGQQLYTIEATGPGGASQAAWTINVVDSAPGVPTSTPTAAPGAPTPGFEPVIYYFQAQPVTIARNSCVNFSWSVGGNASRIRLVRNNRVIQENLPFRSSWNDCGNSNVGTVVYLLIAQNNFNQTVTEQAVVTVTP